MKSRDEYEASIFAKRDALLEKRKKRITAITSALCIVLCFSAAAIFMPKNLNKSNSDIASTATTTSTSTQSAVEELVGMGGESGVFDAAAEAENALYETTKEEVEYLTQLSDYTKPVTNKETKKQQINFGYSPENNNEKNTTAAAVATQTEIALETEIFSEDGCPEETTKKANTSTTARPLFNDNAEEKAIDVAYGYLTNEQKANVDMDAHIDVSVTRNADGTEYFTVHFDTAEGAYLVSVDSKTFEFVKFKELKKSTQAVSQGYNPDTTTAKPPMMPTTTAAPEYIPE